MGNSLPMRDEVSWEGIPYEEFDDFDSLRDRLFPLSTYRGVPTTPLETLADVVESNLTSGGLVWTHLTVYGPYQEYADLGYVYFALVIHAVDGSTQTVGCTLTVREAGFTFH